jgi:hypothetical protein
MASEWFLERRSDCPGQIKCRKDASPEPCNSLTLQPAFRVPRPWRNHKILERSLRDRAECLPARTRGFNAREHYPGTGLAILQVFQLRAMELWCSTFLAGARGASYSAWQRDIAPGVTGTGAARPSYLRSRSSARRCPSAPPLPPRFLPKRSFHCPSRLPCATIVLWGHWSWPSPSKCRLQDRSACRCPSAPPLRFLPRRSFHCPSRPPCD